MATPEALAWRQVPQVSLITNHTQWGSMAAKMEINWETLGKKIELFQIQQLIYHYSFSMRFIKQIFLFMNSVFNIFIILGNRPDPILIFQHSHNFSSIMNLHLISGFPKEPIFAWEWGSIPEWYRLQSWRVPNVELWMWLVYSISPFLFSLSLSLVCVYVYEHSPMRCNESFAKSRWRARLGFIIL